MESAPQPVAPAQIARGIRLATWGVIALHAALLVVSLPDFRVGIDSGYHVSLGRWYGEHGTAFWDHINFGPGGRPNLQGPAMHMAIGALGRLLGGTGDDYVLANAILALLQWAAAVFTVWWFARRWGGHAAALIAVSLLAGSAYASAGFYVGVPSGWIFILTPWAIHFFLEDRPLTAAVFTSLSIYVHLGGYLTAPAGIFVAALLTKRWRALAVTGAATLVLTAPYTVHFLGNLAWYRGQRGAVAVWLSPLIYLPAAVGAVRLLRRPRANPFLVAWLAAPAAWIVQDYTRFLLQATLALAVVGALELARLRRTALLAAIVVLANVFPLGMPAFALELPWALGLRFPRFVDWNEYRAVADVIVRAGLAGRLVSVYNPTQGVPIAVYAPVRFERGHWVEVQPREDPARRLSAGVKVYVAPMPPDDAVLAAFAVRGWLKIHGGTPHYAVVTLAGRPPVEEAEQAFARVGAEEGAWLATHSENNSLPPASQMLAPEKLARRRLRIDEQRARAGRIYIAGLLRAYALEPGTPEAARRAGSNARQWGELANRLGDDATINFASDARHRRLKENLARWADAPQRRDAEERLFQEYF